jgi:cytoskeletal protein RodZ
MDNNVASWKDYVGWGLVVISILVAIAIAWWQISKANSRRRQPSISQKIKSGDSSEIYQAGGSIDVKKK